MDQRSEVISMQLSTRLAIISSAVMPVAAARTMLRINLACFIMNILSCTASAAIESDTPIIAHDLPASQMKSDGREECGVNLPVFILQMKYKSLSCRVYG